MSSSAVLVCPIGSPAAHSWTDSPSRRPCALPITCFTRSPLCPLLAHAHGSPMFSRCLASLRNCVASLSLPFLCPVIPLPTASSPIPPAQLKEQAKDDAMYAGKEAFVTGAYRKKLEEDKKWAEAEALRWVGSAALQAGAALQLALRSSEVEGLCIRRTAAELGAVAQSAAPCRRPLRLFHGPAEVHAGDRCWRGRCSQPALPLLAPKPAQPAWPQLS